jgi:prephenate dehydrogenase
VCTPISAIGVAVRACLEWNGTAAVTDVGSVKAQVLAEVEADVPSSLRPRFVGGHPMGGSERAGPEAASASLIEGVAWVLTPAPWTDPEILARVEAYVTHLGAHPIAMAPDHHDRVVALVSHLPQVASSALMSLVAGQDVDDPTALALAGSGFRDVTRLAGSDPDLWAGILGANREALVTALDAYLDRLRTFRDLAARDPDQELRRALDEARRARAALGAKAQVRAGMALLQVPVPDRPGVLAHLTAVLGEGDVNIEDLQIVHSPWGPTGVVHVMVLDDRADAALAALGTGGFQAVRVA